ncbi:histone-lysine N-methyltransferase SETDB1-like isoform X2 [Ruditapes philippinarum]|uniref:histone-lysine N-methyltransferase SETDB1-like isoform X2 n=1 Tax=Ruditapes philippinarum TaxID=129788 RepID=UPI00295BDC46|nr:histone-lysine N-methyltransferase SETDB1-like isoform X2 [Ruditapes philippinarum]
MADEGMKSFQFNCDINLEDIVDSAIADLCDSSNSLEAKTWESELQKIQNQVKTAERKQKEINRLFSDCMSQLVGFRDALEEEEKADMIKHEAAKLAFDNASTQPREITIDDTDDDDDDVQFIQKTYDPMVAIKRQGEITHVLQSFKKEPNAGSTVTPSQTRANLSAALSNAGSQNPPRTIDTMRKILSASLSQQSGLKIKISGMQHSQHAQNNQMAALSLLQQKKHASSSYQMTSLQNQERMERTFLEDVNKMKPGMTVLSRRTGDMWEKGTITEIYSITRPVDERKYKIKFEQRKISKVVTPKQVAFLDSINKPVTVGTRIIALYKDEDTDDAFYAGIVAEAPNGRNELRYLVFFDDGYAQYCSSREIHKVFYQSKNVWDDIHPDSQDFVKDYLAQYPERPMVRLHKGQTVKTEWKGKWWTAKVDEVDASLVLMFFPYDKRSEWIYRGSTRLEPLYTALANAEANRNAGKVKRHNLTVAGPKKPVVEYTRNNSSDNNSPAKADKKKSVAKKSTTQGSTLNTGQIWEAPWIKIKKDKGGAEDKKPSLKVQSQDKFTTSTISSGGNTSKSSKDMATVLQERLAPSEDAGTVDLESFGTRRDHIISAKDKIHKKMVKHVCSRKCLNNINDDPEKLKGNNPLLIPLFYGWERHVAKTKPYGRRVVFYRAPCGRRLRNLDEVDSFLEITKSGLSIDNFCCDAELHVHHEFIPVKTFCDIKDISYGKENVVISCVNGIDRQYPDYVDYSNQRIPASGVKLNLDPNFLECCDCEDNCRDRTKCRCQQLTIETSAVINGGKPIPDAGYHYRRLQEPLLSGVYECNSRCKCDNRCRNRVVQNGLSNRLQVFKTEKRGWGLRCLDDIPKGGFICIYAGQLLTDQGANEDGQQYGDEYLAELDYIEVVERQKEGYESDVEDIDEGIGGDDAEFETDESEEAGIGSDSDESFTDKKAGRLEETVSQKLHVTRRKSRQESEKQKTSREVSAEKQLKKKQTAQKSTSGGPIKSPESTDCDLPDLDETEVPVLDSTSEKKRRTGRSTAARYGQINPSKKDGKDNTEDNEDSFHGPSTRDFYQDEQSCYIMDAKSMGNIGRYLNHSCFPNAFVQNVFADTHDLRFPWIAFFAGQYISAGSELTWDYNYEVGSVPGKVLYCYCGSADCRGRLL